MVFICASRSDIQRYIDKEGYEYADDHGIHESLRCTITQEILVDPVTTPCDHTYSKAALHLEIRRQHRQPNATEGSPVKCPLCNGLFTASDLKPASRLVSSVLDSLSCVCPLSEVCEWRGPRDKLPSHLHDDCKGVSVRCPQQTCREWIPRAEVDRHVEEACPWVITACPYCHKPDFTRGALDPETGEHALECSDWPTICDYCYASIRRKDVNRHRRGCDKSPAICSQADWGCTFTGPPLSGPAHEEVCHYVAASPYFQLFLEQARPDTLASVDRVAVATAILAAQRGLRDQLDVERAKRASAQAQLLHIQRTLIDEERATPRLPQLPRLPDLLPFSRSFDSPAITYPSPSGSGPVASTSRVDIPQDLLRSLPDFDSSSLYYTDEPEDEEEVLAERPLPEPAFIKQRSNSTPALTSFRPTLPHLRRPSATDTIGPSTPPGASPARAAIPPSPLSQPVSPAKAKADPGARKAGFFAAVRRDFITLGGSGPSSSTAVTKAVKAVAQAAEAQELAEKEARAKEREREKEKGKAKVVVTSSPVKAAVPARVKTPAPSRQNSSSAVKTVKTKESSAVGKERSSRERR